MEKRKINIENCSNSCVEDVVRGTDYGAGEEAQVITVRNHIPYEEKEKMAHEILEQTTVIHEDACAFEGSTFDVVEMCAIAKYYTSIDTEDVEPRLIADYLINYGLIDEVRRFIMDDYKHVMSIYEHLLDSIATMYDYDGSMTKALRTSFGFLFNGEDITESLAKAEATKSAVYEAINAFRSVEKEKSENIDGGTMKVGGNVINFAKKKQ